MIERLKTINADIFLLQELDWGCERTKFKNVCKVKTNTNKHKHEKQT